MLLLLVLWLIMVVLSMPASQVCDRQHQGAPGSSVSCDASITRRALNLTPENAWPLRRVLSRLFFSSVIYCHLYIDVVRFIRARSGGSCYLVRDDIECAMLLLLLLLLILDMCARLRSN